MPIISQADVDTLAAIVSRVTPDPVVAPPVVTPPPVVGSLVHPSVRLSDCNYLDRALGVGWKRALGDCLDADGVLNGPKPTLQASGKSATIDISKIPGDILAQGVSYAASILIDGKDPAACFTDKSSNHAFPIPVATVGWPGHSSQPIIIPNDGGKSLTIVSNSTGTFRLDPVALPTAAPPKPDGGYYRAPDLLRIDPTSFDAVVIPGSTPAGSTATNRCFGGATFYKAANGVPYVEAHCAAVYDPIGGNGRVARCDYPVAPQAEMYVAYLLGIGPTVALAVTDLGVKLTGMTGDGGLLNMGEHINLYYFRNPRNGSAIGLRDQYYSAEAGIGQGAGNEQNSQFSHGFLASPGWTLIEHGAIPNTFKADGTPNQDGHKLTWINGVLVEDRLIAWFKTPGMLWRNLSMQIYHGGTKSYARDCYYNIGPYMASTKRIGVDPAFLPLLQP